MDVEHQMSRHRSLRVILLLLGLAFAVLMVGASRGYWRPAAPPQAPASVHVQTPSAAQDRPVIERAEDGPKQCVGPREIEGPLCS
jgi:hypothetical protein